MPKSLSERVEERAREIYESKPYFREWDDEDNLSESYKDHYRIQALIEILPEYIQEIINQK